MSQMGTESELEHTIIFLHALGLSSLLMPKKKCDEDKYVHI